MRQRRAFVLLLVAGLTGCTVLPPYRAEIAARASDTNTQITKIITTLQTRPEEQVPYAAVEQYVVAALANMAAVQTIGQTRIARTSKQPAGRVAGWAQQAAEGCSSSINSQRHAWGTGSKQHQIEGWENVRDVCLHASEFEDVFKDPTGGK